MAEAGGYARPGPKADLLALAPFGVRGRMDADGVLHLQQSAGLRSWPVRDADGTLLAMVHGLLVEGWLLEGLALRDGVIHAPLRISSAEAFEQRVLRGLAGSFVVETLGEGLPHRLYPDCGGTLPVVFCAELRRLGGSADQILDDDEYQQRFLADRYQKLVAREGDAGWIPGTLTAHRGVSRLLSNHYLDLGAFTQHRFWPSPALLAEKAPETEETARAVAADMAGFSRAVLQQWRVAIALTAGQDSRLVLGSVQGAGGDASAFTLADGRISPDQLIPARVAALAGVPHQRIATHRATAAETEHWERLVGHALRSSNRVLYPSLLSVRGDVLFSGLYGEPARCFLYGDDWREIDGQPADAKAADAKAADAKTIEGQAANLMARLKQPRDDDVLADLGVWLQPLAHLPRSTMFDLAYLELRMGSWAMGQAPVQSALFPELMPFAQWSIQERFLMAPLADRASGRLLQRIGEILWPEGMQLPINRFGDWRDSMGPLLKLMRPGVWVTARRFLRMKRS